MLLIFAIVNHHYLKTLPFHELRKISEKKQLTTEKTISIRGRVESAMMLVLMCDLQFSKPHEPLGFWAEFTTMAGLYGTGGETVYLKPYMA